MALFTRPGQDQGAGDNLALFYKIFSGEVLSLFDQQNKFLALTKKKVITSGKSAGFNVLGAAGSKYHIVGEDIITTAGYTSSITSTEKIINVDSENTSNVIISDIDELMNHYEARSEYVSALVRKLTREMDTNILGTILAASKADENIAGETGRPVVIWRANYATVAADLRQGIHEAKASFDKKDVPEEDRYVALGPDAFQVLARDSSSLDQDRIQTGQDAGKGQILRVAGMTLVQTNSMPTLQNSTLADPGVNNQPFAQSTGVNNDGVTGAGNGVTGAAGLGYNGDGSKLVALCFQRSAVGTVMFHDVKTELSRESRLRGDLMVASYVAGHNVLRPEAAIHLSSAVSL